LAPRNGSLRPNLLADLGRVNWTYNEDRRGELQRGRDDRRRRLIAVADPRRTPNQQAEPQARIPATAAGQENRGVENRGIPAKAQTIDLGQAVRLEAARLKALAPGTYRRPGGEAPVQQDFEAFSRKYDQLANERHVWRFARPDGSTYETSWNGLGTWTTAQALASLLGHRVVGEVIAGPATGGIPAPEAPLSYTPPPLIPAEPPSDSDRRGTANKFGAPVRKAKKSIRPAPPSLGVGTWSARLTQRPPDEIVPPGPAVAGVYAGPQPRSTREAMLAARHPTFGWWLVRSLQPTVSNFQINLGTRLNDVAQLTAAGIIFAGQNPDQRGTVLENGSQRNAFRHTFGQALITNAFGRQRAIEAGYAHEDQPAIDTSRRFFSNPAAPGNALFEADTVADQLNNEIGRRIAERLGPGADNRDLAAAVIREFRDNGLYIATAVGPGEVWLSRQPLSQQQFEQMMRLLPTLNEIGRLR
jgi:hypothetical protein